MRTPNVQGGRGGGKLNPDTYGQRGELGQKLKNLADVFYTYRRPLTESALRNNFKVIDIATKVIVRVGTTRALHKIVSHSSMSMSCPVLESVFK